MPATTSELLNKGATLTAKLANGRTEQVKVRILPVRGLEQYLELMGKQAALAELFCNKPAGWSDTLDQDTVYQICDEGERLNQDPFAKHLKRMKNLVGRSVQAVRSAGIQVPVPEGLEPEAEATASPDSSPAPA